MKIGNIELPDICPNCKNKLIKTPGPRLLREGGSSYSSFYAGCLHCKWKSDTYKIRDDYFKNNSEIKDVTPYKKYLFGIFKKIKKDNDIS